MRRLHPDNLRAAWWAFRAARGTRRRLAAGGLEAALAVPPPPPLPSEAERGVRAALRRRGDTCLVAAIVRQAWEAKHGRSRDLVIGVTGRSDFRAHAWLEGDPVPSPGGTADLDPSQLGIEAVRATPALSRAGDARTAVGTRFHELLRCPPVSDMPSAQGTRVT